MRASSTTDPGQRAIRNFDRRLLSVLPPETAQIITTGLTTDVADAIALSPARDTEDGSSTSKKRRKSTKGWDGEEIPASAIAAKLLRPKAASSERFAPDEFLPEVF